MSGLSMYDINKQAMEALTLPESNVRNLMSNMDTGTAGPQDMLKFQFTVSVWTTMTQVASALQKEATDAVKGVIAKVN